MTLPAICIVAYNRTDSLRRLLGSLERASYPSEEVTLVISIDKSDTSTVEDFADGYQWKFGPKRVIKHDRNLGLRKHVLSCGDLLDEFESIIVIEDDIYVAPDFYNYATACIDRFSDDDRVAGISLYNFRYNAEAQLPFNQLKTDSDVYMMQLAQSWGQVWMRKQWCEFRKWYDGLTEGIESLGNRIPASILKWPESSWLKYHTAYCICADKYFIYPYFALSTCFAEAGEHTASTSSIHQSLLYSGRNSTFKLNPTVIYDAYREFVGFGEYLGIDEKDLCTDYFGLKGKIEGRRYLLTRQCLPFRRLRSFGLELRPYELNVINGIEGNMLFLYDTQTTAEAPKHADSIGFDMYNFGHRVDLKWQLRSLASKTVKKIIGRK